jgi:hypothetical protein
VTKPLGLGPLVQLKRAVLRGCKRDFVLPVQFRRETNPCRVSSPHVVQRAERPSRFRLVTDSKSKRKFVYQGLGSSTAFQVRISDDTVLTSLGKEFLWGLVTPTKGQNVKDTELATARNSCVFDANGLDCLLQYVPCFERISGCVQDELGNPFYYGG